MSELDDDHAPISNHDEARELTSPTRGEGEAWPLGEHAARGLESMPDWSPPAYRPESTRAGEAGPRGIDSLLPDAPRDDAPRDDAPRDARAATHAPRYRPEATIGDDERVRVYETTHFPWRSICQLTIHTRDGEEYIGTGFFIGPRTVATAGHCVYLPEMGGWAERIVITPGRNGRARPYSSIAATRFHSIEGWTEKLAREHDYAAITLPPGEALPELGALGYAVYDTATLMSSMVNLAGYPIDKDEGTTLWWSARRSATVERNTLHYAADTAAGQSGAPVWRLDPRTQQRVVVGIHTGGARTGNSATRITSRVFANLRRWCRRAADSREDPPR